jgi:hypothetical protein
MFQPCSHFGIEKQPRREHRVDANTIVHSSARSRHWLAIGDIPPMANFCTAADCLTVRRPLPKAALVDPQRADPDVWFNNVEIVVGEELGIETTTYVRNIYKYYASYRLLKDAEARRTLAAQQVGR